MPTPRLDLVLVSVGCLVTAFSAAQSQQASLQPNADVPKLRVTTRLVEVNVIVNDKQGNPVSGLTQKDFSVSDNGKPEDLRAFSAETNLASSADQSSLPDDIYTNRVEERTKIPASVTVILLDALNTEAADQVLVQQEVIRVLEQSGPGEFVALYWLGNDLRILHEFTTDSSILRKVLAGVHSRSSRELDNSELADPSLNTTNPSTPSGEMYERQRFRSTFDQRVANESSRERVHTTVAALVAIADHLRTRPGRKNLIWVSSSFPIELGYDRFDPDWMNDTGARFEGEVARAAQALTDADIAIYPVDARGLLGTDSSASGDDLGDHIGDPRDVGKKRLPTREAPATLDTMRILAERTGGKAFYGTNGIASSIRHAMNDARVTYTLGYYPANAKWDRGFHEIKVKVARSGVEVRARKGYFALPGSAPTQPKDVRLIISQLAASRLPATGIGLHVRTRASADALGQLLATGVHLDLHEIRMQPKDGRWVGTVQSVFLQLDTSGRILHADDRTFHPEFSAASYEQALASGISDSRDVRLLQNVAELCIVVRDGGSANIGSIYIPVGKDSPVSAGRNNGR